MDSANKFLADYAALEENSAYALLMEQFRGRQRSALRIVLKDLDPEAKIQLALLDDLLGTLPGIEPASKGWLDLQADTQREIQGNGFVTQPATRAKASV